MQPVPTITKQPTRHIDSLKPHPDNPRSDIRDDDPRILELAGSIIQKGIIEPLVINRDGVLYAGHRRRVASRVAHKQTGDDTYLTVPVVYTEAPLEEALEVMLHENAHRANLTPLEEARALGKLKERKKLTTNETARRANLAPNVVAAYLSVLKLEPEVQALYDAEELPLSVASLLTRVQSPDKQISWAGLIARRQISLAEFRKQVVPDLAPLPADSAPTVGEGVESVQPEVRGKRGGARAGYATKGKTNGNGKGSNTPTSGLREHPTRAEAVAALAKKPGSTISLANLSRVLETICCSCGMAEQPEVCRACPLPRLILGAVGRADEPPKRRYDKRDDEEEF